MHPKDDSLRALLDSQLLANEDHQVCEHLADCTACQARLAELQTAAERVQAQMSAMTPRPHEQPRSPNLAYARFAKNIPLSIHKKEPISMFTRRPLWTALAVIAILVLVFTITPASAWASNFLGLFRVQNITVVQFDPRSAQFSGEGMEANQEIIEQIFNENLEIDERGEPVIFDSVEAAAAAAGFSPRLPTTLENPQFAVQPGMQAVLTIDRELMQSLLDVAEVDFELPSSVDGKRVTVEAKDTLLAGYGCQPEQRDAAPAPDCTVLVQLPSPTIDAPEGLNIERLGEAMLQFLGLSKAEASALSQQIDWTTTLILPIPQGEGIQYQEVAVDGVTGTFIQEEDQNSYMLLWVKDGFLYGLKGPGGAAEALNIASSVQ